MWRSAAVAAMLWVVPAQAGEWQYDPASDTVFYGSMAVAQWYGERPSMQPRPWAGPLQRAARCPHRLCGYPLPIYKARQAWPVAQTYRVVSTEHVAWCAGRYRSYDVGTDTYQPHRGGRRLCWSPWR